MLRTLTCLTCLTAIAFVVLAGCGRDEPRVQLTTADHVAALQSPDPVARARAADSLNHQEQVPAEAIDPLIAAFAAETNAKSKGAMIIALGVSADAKAGPLVEDYVQKAADADQRRWGSRALKWYLVRTGKLQRDEKLPPGWPYGQPGYPERLPAK